MRTQLVSSREDTAGVLIENLDFNKIKNLEKIPILIYEGTPFAPNFPVSSLRSLPGNVANGVIFACGALAASPP